MAENNEGVRHNYPRIMDTESVNKLADALRSKPRESSEVEAFMKSKEKECGEHKDKTEKLHCTLLDPENGLAVRIARIEVKQDSQKEDLTSIKNILLSTFGAVMLTLMAIIGFYFQQVHFNDRSQSVNNGNSMGQVDVEPSEEDTASKPADLPPLLFVNEPVEKLLRSPRLR